MTRNIIGGIAIVAIIIGAVIWLFFLAPEGTSIEAQKQACERGGGEPIVRPCFGGFKQGMGGMCVVCYKKQ